MNKIFKSTLVRFISTNTLRSSGIEKNVALQQFRLKLDGNDYATVEFTETDKHVDLIHSIVPQQYKGQGIGRVLAEKTFDYIIGQKKQMILTCDFLKKYYEDNKQTYKSYVIE